MGELAVVGTLAAATTVGLTRGEAAPRETPLPERATVGPASSAVAPVSTAATLPLPAVPAEEPGVAASSGRSVGRSTWRTAIYRTPAHKVADIPMRALEAYQRAATVIDMADSECRLGWPLLAAIAKVESDHGRYGGGSIESDGRVHPLILGPRLTGSAHTSRTADTDAGRLDGDLRVDRAVGPFQIVPATWAQVRVDADGDGRRNPQDIDDAALGAAVFLCSGHDDLSTRTGQRQAVHRYNRDGGYVDLVMDVERDYEQADLGQASGLVLLARDGAGASAPWSPNLTPPAAGGSHSGPAATPSWDGNPDLPPTASGPASPSAQPTPSPSPSPSPSQTPTPDPTPTPEPTPTPDPTPTPTPTPTPDPTPTPTRTPDPTPTPEPTPTPTPTPSDSPSGTEGPTSGSEAARPADTGEGDGAGTQLAAGLPWALPVGGPLVWLLHLRRRRTATARRGDRQ